MNLPRLITFTGVDDHTDLNDLVELTTFYPQAEFGVLFSPKQQGNGRYPTLEFVGRLLDLREAVGMRLAAHLCGGHARALIAGDTLHHEVDSLMHAANFDRVQINTADPKAQPLRLANWGEQRGLEVILQCRDPQRFPGEVAVQWLFDQSGGRGTSPADWPMQAHSNVTYGYAGGIGPDNAADVMRIVGSKAERYNLDMESKLRDENDRFDIQRCYRVCEAAWGPVQP